MFALQVEGRGLILSREGERSVEKEGRDAQAETETGEDSIGAAAGSDKEDGGLGQGSDGSVGADRLLVESEELLVCLLERVFSVYAEYYDDIPSVLAIQLVGTGNPQ